MRRIAAFLAAFSCTLAMPAAAQDEDPYADCAATTDDAARLACFDATYAEQRVVVAEQAEEQARQREEAFGFREEDEAIAQDEAAITATVTEVLQGARRSQVLLLDNGQLWREIDGSTMRNRVREGMAGSITRHWSGAYEMRFDGRSGYLRVTRVR
ncbi:hypothetical protein [Aurantiacibacter poecillastricola]|uniref:hypothetical protein n=1 Tax=Aurantiacibacter poecillastricola TaxID=3064385 RepID=UPI00273FE340|nr:hypothetical protein [Aurantiacibacter sp. 219JJ12-13]MDP5260781.1 hypothetical protein [Aurantiacibacter sp. 219JJ12-13]